MLKLYGIWFLVGCTNQQDFTLGKGEDVGVVQEKSTKSLVIGPLDFRLDSSAVHRILKMIVCALEHEYEPYSQQKPGLFLAWLHNSVCLILLSLYFTLFMSLLMYLYIEVTGEIRIFAFVYLSTLPIFANISLSHVLNTFSWVYLGNMFFQMRHFWAAGYEHGL